MAPPALSCLSLSQVLRTWAVTSVSSSPAALDSASAVLRSLLASKSAITSVDKNPILHGILKETFYKQFCAGETRAAVQQTCTELRQTGYEGVILEYALEVLADSEGNEKVDVERWHQGMKETVDIAAPGDFVGLKWSGMGAAAMRRMADNQPPTQRMDKAMREVCDAAVAKNVMLLPAAEETNTLAELQRWTINLQQDYNRRGKAVVYSTYQAYLQQTPGNLVRDLTTAKAEGFILGAKMVRGAYMSSEPKYLLQPSREATGEAYDSIAAALLQRRYTGVLAPLHGTRSEDFPEINIVLASHNAETVRKAQALRNGQTPAERIPLAYAQLQGMADEVSCSLISAAKTAKKEKKDGSDVPRVFKCTTWGSMGECLNYLLRRAAENKDAATRTVESRKAMAEELGRRMRSSVGLS